MTVSVFVLTDGSIKLTLKIIYFIAKNNIYRMKASPKIVYFILKTKSPLDCTDTLVRLG